MDLTYPQFDKNQFRLKFLTEKMHANEPLSVFNKRFSEMEETMARIDSHFDVDSIDNLITYVNALDNKRYAEFKSDFLTTWLKMLIKDPSCLHQGVNYFY